VDSFLVDSSCAFTRDTTHEDALTLATEFLQHDSAGEFMQANPWFDAATTCPGHEPGIDGFTVIAGYSTSPRFTSDTLVVLAVTYWELGSAHFEQDSSQWHGVFLESPSKRVDSLVLLNTPFGWRVRSPAPWGMVGGEEAIEQFKLHSLSHARVKFLRDSLKGS